MQYHLSTTGRGNRAAAHHQRIGGDASSSAQRQRCPWPAHTPLPLLKPYLDAKV